MKCVAPLVMATALPLTVSAAELQINPGLWETTTTHTNPYTGTRSNTGTECVEETTFDPEDMLASVEKCDTIKSEVNGDRLEFRMECQADSAVMKVNGMYQADGDSGKGEMDMTMDMGDMSMDMQMTWTSKRLGDCS